MNPRGEELAWQDDPLWYKDAIIYQLHVRAFFDSNNDGTGDFRGLTQKLDYIQDLGVNAIWLLPFYPSPLRDDGYDIADYRNIYPDYGTRRDVRHFVREAHRRGLKVITELVINHTSDQHPWFQAARRAPPGSAKRDFYVWSDTDQKFPETRIIFTDTETSNWAWDPVAKAYYWHRFFSHQPDLNHNNPQVVRAVIRVMRFWLDMGVDGLRLDAIPYLCVREGTHNENLPESHEVLKEMRAVVDEHYQGRMFLAEANQWPEDVREYFGDGDECHMAYHFPLMPRMYMAIAQEDRHPITEIMNQTPDIPQTCQWAIFLRNHDELTLEMVTDKERDYMYQSYAANPRMRVNVGIRRRLAPLMDNDLDKIRLMNSLLFSMPGSPIIYYGDEIGMGDNIYLGDRNSVRTPMQWSPDRNAGFSKTDPQRLFLPPIMDPIYGYEGVNVEAQSRAPSSLLNWMKRLLAVRKSIKTFGRGTLAFLRPGNRKILAYVREWEGEAILCVANLSRCAQPVELDLSRFEGRVPLELMGHTPFPPIGELPYLLTLPGHGFYWFRLAMDVAEPAWHEQRSPPAELPVLVLFDGWDSLFPERVDPSRQRMAEKLGRQLEQALGDFLLAQRWFAAKGEKIERIALEQMEELGNWLLARVRVEFTESEAQSYFIPLAIAWGEGDEEPIRRLLPATIAKIRRQARLGILYDALEDINFSQALVMAMGQHREILFGAGRLKFSPTTAFEKLVYSASLEQLRRPAVEGTNSTLILDNRLFLKIYRYLEEGINSEREIGYFLTEISPFPHIAPLAGTLEYISPKEKVITLALLQGFVSNQGDAWAYTVAYLERFLEHCLAKPLEEVATELDKNHEDYLRKITLLGRRTGELHQALAKETGNPAFDPEPIVSADLISWRKRLEADIECTFKKLAQRKNTFPESLRNDVEWFLRSGEILRQRLCLNSSILQTVKTRYHGDYHLGQVLVAEDDLVIIDFEGEPARPLRERRKKHSPLRDVAGMLRSFNYAAVVALRHCTAERPEDQVLLMPLLHAWEQQAREYFLTGYREGMRDCPSYPVDSEQAHDLITLFTLEKALYELRYELDNRPAWVEVPLRGLLAFLEEDEQK
ncbi:trehalose synthase [Nitrosococcus oceani ATCC 19707]|uniref:Maltokinase n=2 Tax=Nitrosococcus oceani TaxID=1229 RepID=Q3JCV3_NITOC|nr:maltose alpha-D-glucosyltransferase [Nitrosococcus oceani]ABA57343.1 trehalose synthase [Nitrosococcus oceani ATCC 19707]EDZ68415.1 Alpha amylase, catalytic domain subfamily, putative [Nitrosococcus oceani AFC27]KFI20319.1 alpha-amylase [Nitrosococcus oceani C-27]GEM20218.1 alpha-amylase [Nitrosococcus oceani]